MSIFRRKHNDPAGEQQPTDAQPQAVENAPDVPTESQEVSFKTVQHINRYPLVQQTKEILDTVAVTRVVKANTKPTVESILNSRPVKFVEPVTKIVDTVADSGLSLTEKVVPSLKTKTYQRLGEEAMIPYNLTSKAVTKTVDTTVSLAESYVYEPAHNQILKFRQYYNENFYDTHGKPLIRGSLDPLVTPCNKWYEMWIKHVLPDGKEVPTNGFSNELDRSFALTFNAVHRAASALTKSTKQTIQAPCNYVVHVNDVLNVNLDKQEDLSLPKSWVAVKGSVQELNQETVGYLKSFSPFGAVPTFKKKNNSEVSGTEVNVSNVEQTPDGQQEAQSQQLEIIQEPTEQQVPELEIQQAEPIGAN